MTSAPSCPRKGSSILNGTFKTDFIDSLFAFTLHHEQWPPIQNLTQGIFSLHENNMDLSYMQCPPLIEAASSEFGISLASTSFWMEGVSSGMICEQCCCDVLLYEMSTEFVTNERNSGEYLKSGQGTLVIYTSSSSIDGYWGDTRGCIFCGELHGAAIEDTFPLPDGTRSDTSLSIWSALKAKIDRGEWKSWWVHPPSGS